MMYGSNWFAMGFGFHMFFGLFVGLGVLFLIIWAFKFADKKLLKKVTMWFLIVGIVGALLTTILGFSFMGGKNGGYFNDWFPVKCRDLTSQGTTVVK